VQLTAITKLHPKIPAHVKNFPKKCEVGKFRKSTAKKTVAQQRPHEMGKRSSMIYKKIICPDLIDSRHFE